MPGFDWFIAIIPAIITLHIGAFIFWAGRRYYLNRVFLLLSLLIVFWQLEGVQGLSVAGWYPLIRAGGVLLPSAFLQFSVAFTDHSSQLTRAVIYIGYVWAGVLIATAQPPIQILSRFFDHGFKGMVSPADGVSYLLYFFSFNILSTSLLIRAYLNERKTKEGIRYLLVIGAAIAAILAGGLRALPLESDTLLLLSTIFSTIYIFVMGWAIWRYEVLNISQAFRSTAVYSIILALIFLAYFALVQYLVVRHYERLGANPFLVGLIATLIVGPLFYPLREYLSVKLKEFFPLPQDTYYFQMRKFSRELASLAPLEDLARKILSFITQVFPVPVVELIVFSQSSGLKSWRMEHCQGQFQFKEGVFHDLGLCSTSGQTITVPLTAQESTIGWLKIGESPERGLSKNEIDLIGSFAGQAGTAVQNALLYTELAALTQNYEALLAGTLNGVMVMDERLRITTINHVAAKLFGTTVDRAKGRYLPELPGSSGLERAIAKLKQTGQPVPDLETLMGPEEVQVPVKATATFTIPVDDQPPSIIIVLTDLTEEKVVEEQMRRAERLAAMGRLTAGLAHEIRNGLNKIGGYALILEDLAANDAKLSRYAGGIGEDVQELAGLLNRFLLFAKEKKGQSTRVDVVDLLRRSGEALDKEASNAGISIVEEYLSQPCVPGDGQRLSMAFFNILLNAVQALAETGGKIIIRVERDEKHCIVQIQDDGPGIPEDQQEAIFDPFFTTKEEGTGLGLPITYKIIDEHGGEIHLKSALGKGTTFTIRLPLCTKDTPV